MINNGELEERFGQLPQHLDPVKTYERDPVQKCSGDDVDGIRGVPLGCDVWLWLDLNLHHSHPYPHRQVRYPYKTISRTGIADRHHALRRHLWGHLVPVCAGASEKKDCHLLYCLLDDAVDRACRDQDGGNAVHWEVFGRSLYWIVCVHWAYLPEGNSGEGTKAADHVSLQSVQSTWNRNCIQFGEYLRCCWIFLGLEDLAWLQWSLLHPAGVTGALLRPGESCRNGGEDGLHRGQKDHRRPLQRKIRLRSFVGNEEGLLGRKGKD